MLSLIPAKAPWIRERVQVVGKELVMAVGARGLMARSRDSGKTWTRLPNVTQADLYGVAYGNGVWMIGGTSGCLMSRNDGDTWVPAANPNGHNSETITLSIEFSRGIFMIWARGSSGTSRLMFTADGTAWTSINSASVAAVTCWGSAVQDGNFVFPIGSDLYLNVRPPGHPDGALYSTHSVGFGAANPAAYGITMTPSKQVFAAGQATKASTGQFNSALSLQSAGGSNTRTWFFVHKDELRDALVAVGSTVGIASATGNPIAATLDSGGQVINNLMLESELLTMLGAAPANCAFSTDKLCLVGGASGKIIAADNWHATFSVVANLGEKVFRMRSAT